MTLHTIAHQVQKPTGVCDAEGIQGSHRRLGCPLSASQSHLPNGRRPSGCLQALARGPDPTSVRQDQTGPSAPQVRGTALCPSRLGDGGRADGTLEHRCR